MKKQINEMQKRFAEEYVKDLNAKHAAIRAGYSPKSARNLGPRLLANDAVRDHIDERLAIFSERTGVTQERVVRELARIAFADLTDILDSETGAVKANASNDDTAAISYIKANTVTDETSSTTKYQVKLLDKAKALGLLGKHLGLFSGKIQAQDYRPVIIIDNIPRRKD